MGLSSGDPRAKPPPVNFRSGEVPSWVRLYRERTCGTGMGGKANLGAKVYVTCVYCGKRAYPTSRAARSGARALGSEGVGKRLYQCPDIPEGSAQWRWHFGDLRPDIIRGERGRDTIQPVNPVHAQQRRERYRSADTQ
jgi:hypothetical protein